MGLMRNAYAQNFVMEEDEPSGFMGIKSIVFWDDAV
jgi:hypothetical protein